MANKLIVAPAPHVQTAQSTTRIMRDVVIALMPALVVSTVVFGLERAARYGPFRGVVRGDRVPDSEIHGPRCDYRRQPGRPW